MADSELPPRQAIQIRSVILWLAQCQAGGCAAAWILGVLTGDWYGGELLTHFQPHYFAVLLLSAVMFGLLKCWRWLAFSAILAVATGWQVGIWYLPADAPAGEATERLKILSANVFYRSKEFKQLLELIRVEDPDLIVLCEFNPSCLVACESLRQRYPYSIDKPLKTSKGIALFSKYPLRNSRIEWVHQAPSIITEVQLATQSCSLVCVHPPTPVLHEDYAQRNDNLRAIPDWMPAGKPALVVGDLNITMWSPNYQDLVANAELMNARQGFGVMPTFPCSIGISIDHILHTREFRVLEFRRGAAINSDHWPVIGVLELVGTPPGSD